MNLSMLGVGSFYMDKENVLKKLTLDMTVANITEHMELTDADAKAGIPDASIFMVPAEWGTCTATTIPPPPKDLPASLHAFYKCVGISMDYVGDVESHTYIHKRLSVHLGWVIPDGQDIMY